MSGVGALPEVQVGIDGVDVSLPGVRAPTVRVPALVNSLPRIALKHCGSFGSFLRSYLSKCPTSRDEKTLSSSLWPMPLPYPEAFDGGGRNGGPTWRKRRTCLQVAMLSWLHLGRPGVCPPDVRLGARLSSKQWKRVRILEWLSEDSNSVFEVDAAAMARTATKCEASSDELDALHRALSAVSYAGFGLGSNAGGSINISPFDVGEEERFLFGEYGEDFKVNNFVVAKQIEAKRIVFEGVPEFDPVPYFDEETSYAYQRPLERSKGVQPVAAVPVVKVHACRSERNALFQKMARTGRLAMVDASRVVDQRCSGLFAVPKDLSRDRLILDSRPANCHELPLSRYTKTMASASCLAGIELEPDQDLQLSGRDVKDFFYQFTVSEERCLRNVLGGRLSAADLSFIFEKEVKDSGYVGLSTMAMGDLSACEYAQAAHLGLILACGGCVEEELLQHGSPSPRGDLWLGVVIDDLVCLEKVCNKMMNPSRSLAGQRLEKIMHQYEKVKLPVNPKKSFDDSHTASFWGVQVDGRKGIYRANDSRFWPLVLITVRVLSLGVTTIGLLQSLCGSWISVMMLRRRMLSVMQLVFEAVACSDRPRQVLRLSSEMVDELMTLCILGTLCAVNMRAKTSFYLKATDASDDAIAAVSSRLPENVAREVQRMGITKSLWTRLLPPGKAWLRTKGMLEPSEEMPDGGVFDTHPLWEAVGRCYQYTELWRAPITKPTHINISELRGYLKEESRTARSLVSVRTNNALDSQVSLGSLVKGRASSRAINAELSRSLAYVVGSDLYPAFGFWPSKMNRADAPTRKGEVPGPDMEKPAWLLALEAGDYETYDDWLASLPSHDSKPGADFRHLKLEFDDRPKSRLSWKERKVEERLVAPRKELVPLFNPSDELSEEMCLLLNSFRPEQFVFGKNFDGKQRGALDLYSGHGGVAKQLAAGGCPWVLTFEIKRHPDEDLMDNALRQKILALLRGGAVQLCGSAIVCSSFSMAVTPPVRNAQYPRGVPWMPFAMRGKVADGNSMADFQALLHDECELCGVRFWTENPDSSHLWRQRKYKKFKDPSSSKLCRVDMCRFGTVWRKRTRIATDLPSLGGVRRLCRCVKGHVALRGNHPTKKVAWTSLAQVYPRGFCKMISEAALRDCNWKRRLSYGACSKSNDGRIGEAKNPGPRGKSTPRGFSLEQHPVQGASSLKLGSDRWKVFLTWCNGYSFEEPVEELFAKVPVFLAHALRRYGDEEFKRGGHLSYYRHLVIAASRRYPLLKPYISICWELAARWEAMEPVCHRPPIPEPLVEALVVLSLQLGWRRWCGILLLCYFGIARAGEVLRCSRRDLLLPCDLLDDESGNAFLVLHKSKTMHRGPARVQHLRIENPRAVLLLNDIYGRACKNEWLFFGSPSVFRRRWDHLLRILQVPASVKATPGGLRGGGAVSAYRKNISIQNLVWRMRIKHIVTLEAYLQEVAALSLLTDLSDDCRRSIQAARSLFLVVRGWPLEPFGQRL